MKTLEFVKVGKPYVSKHGGNWFHIYFKDENKSYRTALFENMRNFNNWNVYIWFRESDIMSNYLYDNDVKVNYLDNLDIQQLYENRN